MNLIQRGTTASRANRGKSVNDSIAQSAGRDSDDGNGAGAGLMLKHIVRRLILSEWECNHPGSLVGTGTCKERSLSKLS